MSDGADTSSQPARPHSVAERLMARTSDPGGAGPRDRDRRRIENAILLALGLLLAVATVAAVVRQAHANERKALDRTTYRHYVRSRAGARPEAGYITVRTVAGGARDHACAVDSRAHNVLCLIIAGPTRGTLRAVEGGYRLRIGARDQPRHRFSCFGAAGGGAVCGRSAR